jgi:hypothetical protein
MNTEERVKRTLTDCQRMLWRDDVENICKTPDSCFEYSDRVRCGPCAIQQAAACGVKTDFTVPNLPEVYRKNCRIKELEARLEGLGEEV